jgi:CheY-like chemotaxis protein
MMDRRLPAVPGDGHRPHVVVIDDTREILELLQELLEEEGYRVTPCPELLDVAHIKALRPDVIVQDLLFAGTQEAGWKLLTLARLDPDLAQIPIVLCTAALNVVRDAEMAEKLRQLGVHVVLKPFNLAELLSVLAAVLASPASYELGKETA